LFFNAFAQGLKAAIAVGNQNFAFGESIFCKNESRDF